MVRWGRVSASPRSFAASMTDWPCWKRHRHRDDLLTHRRESIPVRLANEFQRVRKVSTGCRFTVVARGCWSGGILKTRPKIEMATTPTTALVPSRVLPSSPNALVPRDPRRPVRGSMPVKNSLHAADHAVVEADRETGCPMVPGVIRAKRVEATVTGVQDRGSIPLASTFFLQCGRDTSGQVPSAN